VDSKLFTVEKTGRNTRVRVADQVATELQKALGELSGSGDMRFSACLSYMRQHSASLDAHSNADISNFAQHLRYYLTVMQEHQLDPIAVWTPEGAEMNTDTVTFLQNYIPEFLSRVTQVGLGWKPAAHVPTVGAHSVFEFLQQRSASQSSELFRKHVPDAVLGLPSEANLDVAFRYFEKSLQVPGDICEFGCFRGLTSVKMAFLVQALKLDKRVYAFDTFEGFQIDDPGQGALKIGAYGDTFDAYSELSKWSNVLPVTPVKGDATITCGTLSKPLSFVWLDLDMDVLMEPVLTKIWPLLTADTIIGIDDIGRPETPTVEPWVNRVLASGRLRQVARHRSEFIGIFQKV
jgi:hypothetical protein